MRIILKPYLKILTLALLLVGIIVFPYQKGLSSGQPKISVNNVSTFEGDSGSTKLNFMVTLSEPAATTVVATVATADVFGAISSIEVYDAAFGATSQTTPRADYLIISNKSVTFSPGQMAKAVSVTVLADTLSEGDELFSLNITSASGASILHQSGTGKIINDDGVGSGFRMGIGDSSIAESTGKNITVQMVVTFSSPAPQAFTLSASTTAGTASAGTDYVSKNQNLSVAAGSKNKVITITIKPDQLTEGSEQFSINVSSTLGTVIKSAGTVIIRDAQASHSRPGRLPGPPRVTFLGDSVGANLQEPSKVKFEERGWQVIKRSVPGSSILDASNCEGQLATTVLSQDDPDIVIFENIGNYGWFTTCLPPLTYGSPEFLAKWQEVTELYTSMLTANGAQVFWLVNPSVPAATNQPRHDVIVAINEMYRNQPNLNPNAFTIEAWEPFGGDPPDCSLRTNGISTESYCVHLSPSGQALMANLIDSTVF
jgi:Calx-beta domain